MSRCFFLVLFFLLCIFLPAQETFGASSGVPQAVWQDSERNHRRSPNQIKTQLRTPQVRAADGYLKADAMNERRAKTKKMIASGEAQIAASPQNLMPLLEDGDFRLKILSAAVTGTKNVLLGDIAIPLGKIDAQVWDELKNRELWPAPPEEGKPLQINRSRLSQALREALGQEYSSRAILPGSLVIQKNGVVFREDDLRNYVISSLTPQLGAMPGEAELTEFRLPEYIFLTHGQQQIQLETGKLAPGRVSLRFAVQEADGKILRKVSGTVKLTLWITAPAAARPLNKGETITPEAITFMRMNASQLKDVPWDGQGGGWQAIRTIGTGEPILQSDLASRTTVRRGNIISLIFSRGNLRMTTQAEALSDGEQGATIPVRNLQTKKQVYAVVRDGSTVEIN